MSRKNILAGIAVTLLSLMAVSCLPEINRLSSQSQGAVETSVFETVYVVKTAEAVNTLVSLLTDVAHAALTPAPSNTPEPSATVIPPLTNTPTPIPTATMTNTPVPTSTNTPSPTVPASTAVTPCLRVQYIQDVTIPDGTIIAPNESFVKTWRLKNAGSCTWTPDFSLVFYNGNAMNGPVSQPINATVPPGHQVDLSVWLTAPGSAGTFTGNWMLRSASNAIFGLGPSSDKPFYVVIRVQTPATWDPSQPLDFASAMCSAVWNSPAGILNCPAGGQDFSRGSVTWTNRPVLEGGYVDDEPALILIPSHGSGGYISGRYPIIRVQSSDRFQALIGCLDNSPYCSATFQLNYRANGGSVQSLGGWSEASEGLWNRLDVDLSFLNGKDVEFILTVVNNNGSSVDDRLFVLAPVIRR